MVTGNPALSKPVVDWRSEMSKIARRYHIIGCWVAIILNPIWTISDIYVIPDFWQEFFVIRVMVAGATLAGLLLRKQLNLSPEVLVLIPFIGISLQNAYMYSVMDIPTLQKHTFAYIAFYIGAGMLVLWKAAYTIASVSITLVANIILFILYSPLSLEDILSNGGLLTATVAIFSIVLIQTRYSLTKKAIISRLELAESNKQLAIQKDIIEEKNKDITDSIRYGQKIQEAILPDPQIIQSDFRDLFILYRPKDIVSGDFYWYFHNESYRYIIAADCTGHGVPGAFMSMIGNDLLNHAVMEKKIKHPAQILQSLDEGLAVALKHKGSEEDRKDGMDLAMCVINDADQTVYYSGAHRPLIRISNGELKQYDANKFPIGKYSIVDKIYEQHKIPLVEGDVFYMFSDGYHDQFGGPKGKKFMTRRFKDLLLSIHDQPLDAQRQILNRKIEEWMGDMEQIDDILVIGFSV